MQRKTLDNNKFVDTAKEKLQGKDVGSQKHIENGFENVGAYVALTEQVGSMNITTEDVDADATLITVFRKPSVN